MGKFSAATIFRAALITGALTLVFSCHTHDKLPKEERMAEKQLKTKYAGLMGVDERDIKNVKLYSFIDEWYGTPYKYGGKTKTGIDCSDFVSTLEGQVFKKNILPPASSMYATCKSVKEKDLEEGDLVFFKINSDKVSHVGVYLQNGCFVHASSKKGVVISKLGDAYYTKHFFKGGKVD
jgi:hypothetical protein